jgi:hypothetical protein
LAQRGFSNPILVPDGRALITLRDAADYIMDLPKETFDLPDWQLAMEALALVSGSEQPPRRREWFFPQAVCSKRSLGSTARDRNSTGFERNAACSDVGLLHFSFCRTVLSRRWKTRYRSACVRNVLNFWRFCVSGVYD